MQKNSYETENYSNLDPTKITLSKSSATIFVTTKISATVKNAVGNTSYKSSNTKVAIVDSKGKVKAKKWDCKITVTNNGVKKTFTAKVKNPYLNVKNKTIKKGQSFELKVIGKVRTAKIRIGNSWELTR